MNGRMNLLDFMGITLDKQGRVIVGYADGCIDDLLPPVSDPVSGTPAPNRCVSAPPPDAQDAVKTKLATIARQSGGLPLFSANIRCSPPSREHQCFPGWKATTSTI